MKIYESTEVVDLKPGDLLRSKRGVHSLVISVGDSVAILTEAGRCYNMSFQQATNGVRLANIDLSGLRFDYVFSECFVKDVLKNYTEETGKAKLVASLADIPAEVLKAALEVRERQNLVHSRPSGS